MSYRFEDFEIKIVNSTNYPGKFVAYIEELFSVAEVIDSKDLAEGVLRPMFDREISRLKAADEPIPEPGSGKAKIKFASNDKILSLSPFIDKFWREILGTSIVTSFVSDESTFSSWEHYLKDGKKELIEKVRLKYDFDITDYYTKPIHEIVEMLRLRLNPK